MKRKISERAVLREIRNCSREEEKSKKKGKRESVGIEYCYYGNPHR